MLTNNIFFKSFKKKKYNKVIEKDLKLLLKENNIVIKSLRPDFKNNYNKKTILKLKNYFHLRVIGMGGSILGTKSIYDFLKNKIKKKFYFIDNLQSKVNFYRKKKLLI